MKVRESIQSMRLCFATMECVETRAAKKWRMTKGEKLSLATI